MRKSILIALAVVLVVALGAGVALAGNGQPASKATAKVGDIAWLEEEEVWTPILTQNIKTPNMKDLFIDVSLQCGIYTETVVLSKKMEKDLATAVGTISVRVKVVDTATDDLVAYALPPFDGGDGVVFAMRSQTLWAVLQGEVELITEPELGIIIVAPEEIGLILDTMDAHSFNFVAPDLPQGDHTIVVEARLDTYTELGGTELGFAAADAAIGYGTVTIQQVRMIKGEELIEVVE